MMEAKYVDLHKNLSQTHEMLLVILLTRLIPVPSKRGMTNELTFASFKADTQALLPCQIETQSRINNLPYIMSDSTDQYQAVWISHDRIMSQNSRKYLS